MGSDAVTLERKSRIVGYKITKGNFASTSPNLPQRIVIIGEANTDNQTSLITDSQTQILSAKDAGEKFGWGSPIYLIARILFPKYGGGIGGIPVFVLPQEEAGGATAKILQITPTGVATGSGVHTVKLSGRKGMDGQFYDIDIIEGDTSADITAKISDAVNSILGAPAVATEDDYTATLTSKWKGATANEMNVTIDTNGKDLGLSYAVASTQDGAGNPSVSASLDLLGTAWTTLIINAYGTNSSVMGALETVNGIPDPETPTGRYSGIIMKPFVALTGTTDEDPSAISDARKDQVTIALCPAPLSLGFQFEAAANVCVRQAIKAQNTPHLDIGGDTYPDMPTPDNIGAMSDYDVRDAFVKKGCSTVMLNNGLYQIQDFVTTYHPVGEDPAQFAYVRNVSNVDMNVRYSYYLKEQSHVVDHVICADDDDVSAEKIIKPKMWKQELNDLAKDLTKRALIVDTTFMTSSIEVGLGTANPDRLETFFRYKRSGVVRIASTTAEAGFNFGTN